MSRRSLRHAIQQYMAEPQIPGIGTVFASPPKIGRSSDAYANLPAGTATGSILYVEVLVVRERRLASGGPIAGVKETRYSLRLHLLCRSRQAKAEDAMDDHDDQVERILDRLREDRTLGTNGVVLQYGQDLSGIVIQTGLPKEGGTGSTHIWTLIDGDAVEIITA